MRIERYFSLSLLRVGLQVIGQVLVFGNLRGRGREVRLQEKLAFTYGRNCVLRLSNDLNFVFLQNLVVILVQILDLPFPLGRLPCFGQVLFFVNLRGRGREARLQEKLPFTYGRNRF